MRIVLIAPHYKKTATGEAWSAFKWIEGISSRCETVVLTQHEKSWNSSESPVNASKIVNWSESDTPFLGKRFSYEVKLSYLSFYFRARNWLKKAKRDGEKFDLVHQINPLGLRFPCPARNLGYKYIIGPLGGSLPTPPEFTKLVKEREWFRKLRVIDKFRLKYDPWLTGSYYGAELLIGVAPYVQELLSHLKIKRFEFMSETGVEQVKLDPKELRAFDQPLRLLFVGRLIPTKGVREAIEATALASRKCNITLDIFGTGELESECRQIIDRLGVGHIVKLHGSIPKSEVFEWYDRCDVFLFPSYREPSGNVVFEAMSRGLPVITTTVGGPGYVVTKECGVCVPPQSRDGFIAEIAQAISELYEQPEKVVQMSSASLLRVSRLAIWPAKIDRVMQLYNELINNNGAGSA